jgi:hypothetical protein
VILKIWRISEDDTANKWGVSRFKQYALTVIFVYNLGLLLYPLPYRGVTKEMKKWYLL